MTRYNEAMAKGDFTTATINDFSRGLNLQDPQEELENGYLGPDSFNVLPVGQGKSLKVMDGNFPPWVAPNSTSRRPVEMTPYSTGLLVANLDGSVDKHDYAPSTTAYAVADVAGLPEVVVSQDSALTTYYAYILRPPGSAQTSVKVNLATNASVTWPGTPPQGVCAITWKTRMVIGSGSKLSFSTEGNPDSWPANNFINIKTLDDARDDIVAFEILGEDLLVFKKRSVWLVFDPVTFDNRRLFSVGPINRRCVARGSERVFWMNEAGVYSTDGTEIREESYNIRRTFTELGVVAGGAIVFFPDITVASYACMTVTSDDVIVASDGSGNTMIGYTQSKDFLGHTPWYSVRGNAPQPKGLVFASDNFGAGFPDNRSVVIAACWESTNRNELSTIFGRVGGGTVFIRNSANVAINPRVQLPTIHNASQEGKSRLRRLNIYGHGTISDISNTDIEVYVDNATSTSYTKTGALAFTGEFIRVRPETRGKNFVIKIKGGGNSVNFQIHAVEAILRRAGL